MCALVSVFLCALCLLSSTLIVNSRPSHGCTFFKSYLFYRIVCSQCVTNSMNFERSVFKFQSLPNCICILFGFLHRIRIFGKWNVKLDGNFPQQIIFQTIKSHCRFVYMFACTAVKVTLLLLCVHI